MGKFRTLCAFLALVSAQVSSATSYYVSSSGSDSNIGSISSSPWKTVSKVNAAFLSPGDFVYFHAGQTFPGNLSVNAHGTATQSIVISSYGSGRATITATSGIAITLNGCVYCEVTNLDVVGPGWNLGNLHDDSKGVYLSGGSSHCTVYSVTSSGFHTAGISLDASTHDNLIKKSVANYNARIGIWIQGKNQTVDACIATYNYGDLTVTDNWSGSGIFAGPASTVTIQYCEAYGNGSQQPYAGNGPVGIWCWDSDHVTIENCLSHDNKHGHATSDGGGFDLDGGSNYCVIENCLSFGNAGVGYMIYNFNWLSITTNNNVIKNCVTQNDAIPIWAGCWEGVPLSNDLIENNIIVRTDGKPVPTYSGTSGGVTFTGNVSFVAGSAY